jgi:hypothetical protein
MSAKISSVAARAGLAGTAAVFLTLGAGCGSDNPAGPGGGSPPGGSGTGTLLVQADVSGSDVGSGVFQTDFTVTLRDTLGATVSGASVGVSTPTGSVILAEDGAVPGTYRAARAGYAPGTCQLTVSRGADGVSSVWVVAPDVHTVTSPAANDTVAAGQPLNVTWTRSRASLEVTLETRDYQSTAPELDDGVSVVPAPGNPARGDQRVRVFRLNRTLMAGGLPGSRFEARIRNSIEPVVAL